MHTGAWVSGNSDNRGGTQGSIGAVKLLNFSLVGGTWKAELMPLIVMEG